MTTNQHGRTRSIFKVVFSARMLIAGVMGFSCGLPLLLTLSVLQAWMTEEGVDLGTIGLFALVQLPYTLKFVWAPLTDRFTPSFLGRRRGWLLTFQLLLTAAIIGLGMTDPAARPWLVAVCALLVTFFSASQDIVVDAYRREALADDELGLGASLYVNGYRLGMLLAGGGGLILADFVPFQTVYLLLGLTMLIGIITTLLAPEPPLHQGGSPPTIRAAVVDPFVEFFRRDGAIWLLAFILLYKLGDSMASAMTTPFYLDIGFSKSEIGAVVKLFGFWATIAGGLVGGILILRAGLYRSLWYFGLLQAVSTAGFVALALIGNSTWALAGVIAFENLSGGMGTAAFVGFMAALTDRRFTATQYALLSSLMGIPRVMASAPTGYLADGLGWVGFFVFCTVIAAPGLMILRHFKSWARHAAGASK